ncbi:MAG: nicotinate phosphoribosyltransferase [Firmicutes bacterium]|nr:nicotinate phosphoribosyltransferase [Bacillota bacterium]
MEQRNLTMLTDLYQLTMMQAYISSGVQDKTAVFDLFFRPGGQINYAVCAGLESVVDYINGLKFTDGDLAYLRGTGLFDGAFLDYLRAFKFTGDIDAVPEGGVVFPREPILIVKAPILEAQLIESALLNLINHQTLIATKASKIVLTAAPASIVEFGLRRAQGPDAGCYGARSAVIGGAEGTSNVMAARNYGLSPRGTHAHSFVQSFASEYEAFRAYARQYPGSCVLLVDTYDTLGSGVPNAIRVFDELQAAGHQPLAIRLDSGDLAYLSKKAREMLDGAGHGGVKIMASGDIDENVILHLKAQGARIDIYGIGTRLITSMDMPALGGVYKLAAIVENGAERPCVKVSDSPEKLTDPGEKRLYRIVGRDGFAIADLIALKGEEFASPLTITDPVMRWKSMTLTDFTLKPLLVPVFKGGKQVYKCPTLLEIARHACEELTGFWDEYKRIVNPHIYKVDLSDKLYELKMDLLAQGKSPTN